MKRISEARKLKNLFEKYLVFLPTTFSCFPVFLLLLVLSFFFFNLTFLSALQEGTIVYVVKSSKSSSFILLVTFHFES